MLNKKELLQWLAEGRTERVLDTLIARLGTVDAELHQEAILISARYESVEKANRLGTLDFDEATNEINEINHALSEVIERLPDEQREEPPAGKSPWLLAGVLLVIAVVGLWLVMKLNKSPENAATGTETRQLPQNAPASKAPETSPATQETVIPSGGEISVTCKSEKGRGSVHYKSGQTLRLYLKVSGPCYVRCLYKRADGRVALLDDNRQISAADADKWLEIGRSWKVYEPYGEEWLYVLAQNAPFEALPTSTGGTLAFINLKLEDALATLRKAGREHNLAESSMMLSTHL